MGFLTKHIMVEELSHEVINKRCLVTIDDAAVVKKLSRWLSYCQNNIEFFDEKSMSGKVSNVLDLSFYRTCLMLSSGAVK